jgi:acyl-CoA synthetase (AMP-forming)/AMP-acid ligase II
VLVPELLRLLLALCANTPALAERLRGCASSPWVAARSPPISSAMPVPGAPVYEGYGLSECGSVVALNGPDADLMGSVGRPCPTARSPWPPTAKSW